MPGTSHRRPSLMQRLTDKVIPWPLALLLLTVSDALYQHQVQGLPFHSLLPLVLVEGSLYGALLWLCLRLDLSRLTLAYLVLPYCFFIPGWLNAPSALALGALLLAATASCARQLPAPPALALRGTELLAFLTILGWVKLSGVGGDGHQTLDWEMHNARLNDLVTLPWPVRYGENQNLVYYFGYFLPAAALGKITSIVVAIHSLYLWTVLGVAIALRWLSVLSTWRWSAGLCLLFIVFGPLDPLNMAVSNLFIPLPLADEWRALLENPDHLDFRSQDNIHIFIGNFLSNSYQLYWSPQQVLSGWIAAGFLTYLFMRTAWAAIPLVYALLCLWAPFVMIALLPLMLALGWMHWQNKTLASLFTPLSGLSVAALLTVFVVFYLGGSAGKNPAFVLLFRLHELSQWAGLVIFYLCSWGLYAALIQRSLPKQHTLRPLFHALIVAMGLLPLYVFGQYADLLCRGSAPLMYLLLLFLLIALQHSWREKHYGLLCGLSLLCVIGSASGLLNNSIALRHYHDPKPPIQRVVDYSNAYPNLGPDQSIFERWFRKPLP